MATAEKKEFALGSHDSGRGIEDKRRDCIRWAEGALLLLIESGVSIMVLVLVVLSVLVTLCG